MYLESKPSDSSREIFKSLYYECQVRGSFCERSEEYNYVVAGAYEPPKAARSVQLRIIAQNGVSVARSFY